MINVIKLEQLEEAVASLSEKDFHQFRLWFMELDWEKWDKQIEDDSRSGKLNFLLDEARQSKQNNQLKNL